MKRKQGNLVEVLILVERTDGLIEIHAEPAK